MKPEFHFTMIRLQFFKCSLFLEYIYFLKIDSPIKCIPTTVSLLSTPLCLPHQCPFLQVQSFSVSLQKGGGLQETTPKHGKTRHKKTRKRPHLEAGQGNPISGQVPSTGMLSHMLRVPSTGMLSHMLRILMSS